MVPRDAQGDTIVCMLNAARKDVRERLRNTRRVVEVCAVEPTRIGRSFVTWVERPETNGECAKGCDHHTRKVTSDRVLARIAPLRRETAIGRGERRWYAAVAVEGQHLRSWLP